MILSSVANKEFRSEPKLLFAHMCIYWFCHDAAQVKTAKNAAIVIIFTYNQLCNDDEWITTFRLKVTQNVLNLYFISIAFVPVNIGVYKLIYMYLF